MSSRQGYCNACYAFVTYVTVWSQPRESDVTPHKLLWRVRPRVYSFGLSKGSLRARNRLL